jgi:hypothetical protein
MDKTKLKELIKKMCNIPIVSINIYEPDGFALSQQVEIIMEVKFSIGMSVSPELLKGRGIKQVAKMISKEMEENFKEKMKLANIKEAQFEIC